MQYKDNENIKIHDVKHKVRLFQQQKLLRIHQEWTRKKTVKYNLRYHCKD